MAGRVIAIGDIHGCSMALSALLDAIEPGSQDTLITLGDYIDRGPDSCGVFKRLLTLANQCQLIPLLGNHEELLLDALRDRSTLRRWLSNGGADTLRSYGWTPGGPRRRAEDWIPASHREFLSRCRPYHEGATHLFVHAGYEPDLPMHLQPETVLRWRVTHARTVVAHHSGKVAVVGHTPQQSGEILDLGFLICLDTNCVRGGWLTALEVNTGQLWQVDRKGRRRTEGEIRYGSSS